MKRLILLITIGVFLYLLGGLFVARERSLETWGPPQKTGTP